MKGSTVFWITIILSIIIKFDIHLYNEDIHCFYKWNALGFVMYETVAAIMRIEDVEYKKKKYNWGIISVVWWLYVLIKYYINPFLNKILK